MEVYRIIYTTESFCSITTAIERKACNCLLLKVNQIGSVSESIEAYVKLSSNDVVCIPLYCTRSHDFLQ